MKEKYTGKGYYAELSGMDGNDYHYTVYWSGRNNKWSGQVINWFRRAVKRGTIRLMDNASPYYGKVFSLTVTIK